MHAPPGLTIRRLVDPTDKELLAATDALDEGFDFKYFEHSMPSDRARSYSMVGTHIRAALADAGGQVYVAEDDKTGQIVGVATWHGPGSEFLSTEEQRQVGWYEMYGKLEKQYQDWWDYFLPLYRQYDTEALGEGTKRASYHLQCLGIIPSHRRRGLGRAMVAVGEEQAKAGNTAVCISTLSTNAVPFYARLGYEVKKPRLYHHAATPHIDNVPMYALIKTFD